MDAPHLLVGREPERARLRGALRDAAEGRPRAVLLHGEAGIGKTSLVRDMERVARSDGFHVLFGQCLRFGADVTSFVPFSQALSHWLRATPAETRERVLPGVTTVGQAVPALTDRQTGLALFQLGAVVETLERDRATLLVVDDLQWADPSSLDVLAYVVAGFTPGQRLTIVGTYRDTELSEGHRLHGWLADIVRMPFVDQVVLDRMDLWAVEQMVLQRGIVSGAALAEEVFRRSGGNPYLADLLLAEASQRSESPHMLGERLSDALATSWHRLSATARRVTQLLAVAGRPVAYPVLRDLALRRGVEPEQVAGAVDEATWQGIVVQADSGSLWFRHPLLAEVVKETLRPWELADLHRDYADVWQSASDVSERERANHLALHFLAAGEHDAAFTWSLRAAEEAEAVRALEEQATHLSQAVALLPDVSAAARKDVAEVELLTKAARTCDAAADYPAAVHHYESALAMVDETADPLTACRILLKLHFLRDMAGQGEWHVSLSEPRQALTLLDGLPPCEERAMALTHLAFAEVFSGMDGAAEHARAAVQMAEELGASRPLIWALSTRAQTKWGTDEGIADAERALALAQSAEDDEMLPRVTIGLSNSYQSAGRYASAAGVTETSYHTLLSAGRPNDAAVVGSIATRWNLALGRWDRARTMVRELLSLARSDSAAGSARCAAAVLSALEGNAAAATLHLRRAEELMPLSPPVGDDLVDTQILVNIALGDAQRALDLVETHMAEAVQVDPITADEFLELAARGASALAEQTGGDGRAAAMAALERIESLRGHTPPPFVPAGELDVIHPALGALYAAERAQCKGDRAALVGLWTAACAATGRADMRYEHARSHYYRARTLLEERQDRQAASESLATAQRIAVVLGAAPLVRDVDALAAQTHLSVPKAQLAELGTTPGGRDGQVVQPGEGFGATLTPREHEVLGGLLAGETYAQIASRLFISQKTVSVHVSNVLRKTGAANRIELAVLAQRSAFIQSEGQRGTQPGDDTRRGRHHRA
ncbi:MAG TPA: AAA family ATPase [Pedococcus sp.]|uniref:helix-turn-helix transcriptional regulator n=1 Tax=Pedococcus sp. TaxID=2860345 RepID=UPI002F924335